MQLRSGSTVTLAVTRQYDRWNRLHTMTAAGTASGLVGQEYTYNDAGQRIRAQLLDGSSWVYEYDTLGQVKSAKRYLSDGQIVAGQQFEYSYDDIGNRTTGKTGGDTAAGNLRTTTDTTDADGRLTQRSNPRQYEVQGVAQAGTEVRVNGVVATRQGEYFRREGTASGTGLGWLDHSVTLNGSTLISGRKKYVPPQTEAVDHDVSGNRISDGRWEMAWDNENRLVDVRTGTSAVAAGYPEQRVRYVYDPDGRLMERRRYTGIGGDWTIAETTRYLNDGWQCVAEFNASNVLQRRQVWGLDLDGSRGGMGGIGGLLWIASQANGTHYAAPDGTGNVVALFGTGGTETARYEYGPFGELLRMSGGAIASENPWRFSSKRQDPTTDWVHYEFRIYDPTSGRWLSRDPIGEAGGENLYGFVGNDPVNRVDLWGLECAGTCKAEPSFWDRYSPSAAWEAGRSRLQAGIDQMESPGWVFAAQAGLELADTASGVIPVIALDRQRLRTAEIYCEQGLGGVFRDAYAQLEEMFGTADLVRAVDYGDEYGVGERSWYLLQGASKSFLTVMAGRGGMPAKWKSRPAAIPSNPATPNPTGSFAKPAATPNSSSQGTPIAAQNLPGCEVAAKGGKPFVPDAAWTKNAPKQVTPGTKTLEHTKFNPKTGEWEKSTVQYDQYGRQTGRTDNTTHGRPDAHPNPHHHTTEYGPGYAPGGKESGVLPGPLP